MENRFAGAHNQAERRRRRLATDDTQPATVDVDAALLAEFSPAAELQSGKVTDPTTLGIVGRMIPQKIWQHVLFLVILGTGLTALLWKSPSRNLPDASEQCVTVRSVTGLLLLFAGQLSFLTGWLREESTVDFRGRYRWWLWLGAGTVGLGLLLITNTLSDLPNIVATIAEPLTGPIVAAKPALVAVPAFAFCLLVMSRVLPDMSRSLPTQALFVLALMTGVLRQMLTLNPAHTAISPATLDALLITSAFFMFASTLLHCRFVAYICNDPPESLSSSKTVSAKPGSAAAVGHVEREQNGDSDEATVSIGAAKPMNEATTSDAKLPAKKNTQKRRSSRRKAA